MKFNEAPNSERIFACFTGRSGSGKDCAGASFPKPYYMMDFDGRWRGVRHAIEAGWLNNGSFDGLEFDEFLPSISGFNTFENKLTELEMAHLTGRFPYKTITISSVGALARLLIIKSHALQSGKMIGKWRVSGPADFQFEVSGVHQVMDKLKTFPCNILVMGHVIDKWGKPRPKPGMSEKQAEALVYAPNEVVGSKLTLRDQLGETLLAYFDDVYQFDRDVINENLRYTVEFANDMAKNSYNLPAGNFTWTRKSFYDELQSWIKKIKSGEPLRESAKGIFG